MEAKKKTLHHVIIGNGMAGNAAAAVLREHDSECRITMVSAGALLFYNRYDLPNVFRGTDSWVDLLVHPPEYYEHNAISLRRKSPVIDVDSQRRVLVLAHREELHYDRLLLATGGEPYLPEKLKDARALMHTFGTYRAAMATRAALPEGGHVTMLGGDVMGLDLARTLIETGHKVSVITNERTFWPHEVDDDRRPRCYEALERMGIEVCDHGEVDRIAEGVSGMPARHIVFTSGREQYADVVMPFFGIAPNVDFMSGSGADMERGILVDKHLKSSSENIWAAGDVSQIWSPESKSYRFYYGYRNVRRMGETAALNMCGEAVEFDTKDDDAIEIDDQGHLQSPFWEHD